MKSTDFVQGQLLIKYLVDNSILPIGAQNVKIEGNIDGGPLLITTTFMANKADLVVLAGFDFVEEHTT